MKPEKKPLVFFDPEEKKTDFQYWQSKTPQERLAALEYLRNQFLTDSNGIRPRLQRVLTITVGKKNN